MTQYEALLKRAAKVADEHPNSYVVIDTHSGRILGTGADPEKLFARVKAKLRPGQVPMVYKKPDENEILILWRK